MSKLAGKSTVAPRPASVLRTSPTSDASTFEGGPAFSKDVKTELFTLAVSNFVSEKTFYEDGETRDTRFRDLVRQASVEDPLWTAKLLRWLRTEGNMRSASIVGAIEYGIAANRNNISTVSPRAVLRSVVQRADEPGEALGYWLGTYGRKLPKWLKRGLFETALDQYSVFSALKYDGQGQPVRFADVIEYSQGDGVTRSSESEALWTWLLDRRHGRDSGKDYELPMLQARRNAESIPVDARRGFLRSSGLEIVKDAGYTWESISGWVQGPMDAEV